MSLSEKLESVFAIIVIISVPPVLHFPEPLNYSKAFLHIITD